MPMSGEVLDADIKTVAFVEFHHGDNERLFADTFLIAAAPDLLAACVAALEVLPCLEVRNWPPGWALKDEALRKLKSAIAKSRGAR